jgi:hypothetical protein
MDTSHPNLIGGKSNSFATFMARFKEAEHLSNADHCSQKLTSLDSKVTEQLQHLLFRASNLEDLVDQIDRELFDAIKQLIEDLPEEAAKSN